MSERKARSPYQKYGKSPYLYSAEYQAWRAAVRRGDKADIERTGRDHSRRFAPYAR